MPIKFCAQCGTELILRFESGRERPVCPQCGYIVYRNPAPVGLVVATRDAKLLLVRRLNPPLAGYWAPPAGHIEIDESLEEGTSRETKEETGLDVEIDRLLSLHSGAGMGVTIAVFGGRVVGGEVAPEEHEVSEVQFFARDELPRQTAPTNGTPIDLWFHAIVQNILDEFKASQTL